jgi:hypothetical protein
VERLLAQDQEDAGADVPADHDDAGAKDALEDVAAAAPTAARAASSRAVRARRTGAPEVEDEWHSMTDRDKSVAGGPRRLGAPA